MTGTRPDARGEPRECAIDPATVGRPSGEATATCPAPLAPGLTITRRTLLRASTAAVALGAAGLWPRDSWTEPRGQPFDDGTYFDDGFGWRD